MLRPLAIATALFVAMVDKCPGGLGKSCTEIGCGDGASLSLKAPGTWRAGRYVFGFEMGGQSFTCTAQLPADLPGVGVVRSLPCTGADAGAFNAAFVQETVCMEQRSRDAVSESCTPLPGRFTLQVDIRGTPEVVGVRVERDGVEVTAQDVALAYQESRPNGPGCEPICRQSRAELTLP
jgi:hypothetical protein